ncbi:hypothetical protein LCI18_012288 [Fusarium solani-melongenae]|uniref:Uncharacterized protein n=1 Tax=Fusarium solani subsp. cucurbitae TaxID=2747967 RepID=A0ACD3ZJV0_FUSSC|nr:hypothetical protein LCI18_012288 [Fusarium solani-melongenae]
MSSSLTRSKPGVTPSACPPTGASQSLSPQDYILSLGWNSPEAYQEFKASPEYQQLMDNLGINLTQPHTQIIIFENLNFGSISTPNTEILTAYWPLWLSPEIQDAVWEAEPLVHTPASRRPSRRCYEQPPAFGWVDEPETWNGDKALASVWLHDWKSEELEARFKRTEKRAVAMGRDIIYPLAIDDFEKRLQDLGALGWESVHVLFQDLNWIYDDEIKRCYCLERLRLDRLVRGVDAV